VERLQGLIARHLELVGSDAYLGHVERSRLQHDAARTLGVLLRLRGEELSEFSAVRHPSWRALRDRIVAALAPYPEASEAVLRALTEGV
jgi:hypothetical protein